MVYGDGKWLPCPYLRKIVFGDHTLLDAADFVGPILIDSEDHKRYRSDGTRWIEVRGPSDLILAESIDIPQDLDYPEKMFASKYNGKEILAGGLWSDEGSERPYLIRYRNGVWTSLRSLIPNNTDRLVVRCIEWDGEKWWVGGRRIGAGNPFLFTIDENDNVTDLSTSISSTREIYTIKTNGKITLIGGETIHGSKIRKLWKVDGSSYTDITADLPDPPHGHPANVKVIDYYKGIWMVAGDSDPNFTKQATLHQWDGTTWTDLTANLPSDDEYRNTVGYNALAHNERYWLLGLSGDESTLVTYDGTTWTTYTSELPGSYGTIEVIVWTGYVWLLSYGVGNDGGFAIWDETTFTNMIDVIPSDLGIALLYTGVYAEGYYFTFPNHGWGVWTRGVRLGGRLCSPWVSNKYRGPIDVETVKANMGRIGSLRVDNFFSMPTINISGGPDWNGKDGEGPYLNLDDNKIYYWSNAAWRSIP